MKRPFQLLTAITAIALFGCQTAPQEDGQETETQSYSADDEIQEKLDDWEARVAALEA